MPSAYQIWSECRRSRLSRAALSFLLVESTESFVSVSFLLLRCHGLSFPEEIPRRWSPTTGSAMTSERSWSVRYETLSLNVKTFYIISWNQINCSWHLLISFDLAWEEQILNSTVSSLLWSKPASRAGKGGHLALVSSLARSALHVNKAKPSSTLNTSW